MGVHVAIINLVYRKSRRTRILKLVNHLRAASQFTAHPIVSVNFVEAVDGVRQSFQELEERYGLKPFSGWAVEDPENKFPSSWRKAQTSGGIASGLSHLDIPCLAKQFGWSDSEEGKNYVLVMEDDCVLTSSPEAAYSHFLNCLEEAEKLEPCWDMVMLGAAGHREDIAGSETIEAASHIERSGFSYLTTMYWLSQPGCGKLILNRPSCVENCLAFDELHNALAGLTARVRPDVADRLKNLPGGNLCLLSAMQSLVRQDPHDCVHDTTATNAKTRRKSSVVEDEDEGDVLPPEVSIMPSNTFCQKSFALESVEMIEISDSVNWIRRRVSKAMRERSAQDWREEFGLGERRRARAPKTRTPGPITPMDCNVETDWTEQAIESVNFESEKNDDDLRNFRENEMDSKPVVVKDKFGGKENLKSDEIKKTTFGLMATLMEKKRLSVSHEARNFPKSFDWYESRSM